MSKVELSFENPAPLYEMLFLGFVPMGVSLHQHKCEDGSCEIESKPMPGYTVVWATESLKDDEVTASLDEGTPGGAAIVLNEGKGVYEVLANEYDGRDRYGDLSREQAEALISSGVLG